MKENSTKINRIQISHYGPLRDIDLELNSGLNVFYGKNESGKTLIVEAITKMLLEDDSNFQGIERVSQKPNGLLTIEKGDEQYDASQESIDYTFGDIKAEDIRNAFIIRDFDLRLPERDNSFGNGDYFNDITDRILGSKTNKIERIQEEISDIGYLTSASEDARLDNTKDEGKLLDKKKKAKDLKDNLDSYLREIREKGIYQSLNKLNTLEEEINTKNEQVEILKNARKQKKYQEAENLLNKVKSAEKDIAGLEDEEKLLEELKEIKSRAENFEGSTSDVKLIKLGSIITTLFTGLALIAAIITPTPVFIFSALIFSALAFYTATKYHSTKKEVNKKRNERDKIIEKARAKNLEVKNLSEVVEEVRKYETNLEKQKQELRGKRNDSIGQLKGKFDANPQDIKEWEDTIEEFSNTFDPVEEEFSQEKLKETENRLEDLKNKREELRTQLKKYKDELNSFNQDFEDAVDGRFLEENKITIDSIEDLEKALNQIEQFIENLKLTTRSSKDAIGILEELKEEESDEFNRLFENESYAVEMFRRGTKGNYVDINYDKGSQMLKTERKDGREITPEELSQGTYDLLFMSIRLSLAKEILEEPGFLVLDNAFVHSDVERVKRELEFLTKLEDEGWQIIYLTFRDDIKKELQDLTTVKELDRLEY